MTTYSRFPPRARGPARIAVAPSATPATTTPQPDTPAVQPRTRIPAVPHGKASLHAFVVLLLIAIVMPIYFSLGSLRLSPNRIILLLAFGPVLFLWLTGAAGRIRAADLWVVALCIWIAVAMTVYGGVTTIEYTGITVIETLGPYLIGRVFIRSEGQYRGLMRLLGWIMLFLLPAAFIETVTGFQIYTRLFDTVFAVFPWAGYEPRLGLFRAQTVFEHPILYGVFCGFCMAPIFHAVRLGGTRPQAWTAAFPVILNTFFSLSMGAYLGLIVQFVMMAWGHILRGFAGRWRLLAALTIAAYVTVDLLSNRTPFEVFTSYATFDGHTAYWRILIFKFGMENVWNNPVFGLGLADWVRPSWMPTGTVDNLWLVFAMRYGIPGFAFLFAAYLAVVIALVRAKPASAAVATHRNALVFSFIGLAIAIATVHLWNASFVFMMFMLGAAAWVADAPAEGATSPATPDTAGPVAAKASGRTVSGAGRQQRGKA